MELTTVVLPTYNRAKLLGDAIASVLDQTNANLELIVVDDGSTDETRALVASLGDPRVIFLQNESNSGVAVALNRGIKAARGDFVAFIGDDDVWLPKKLELQVDLLTRAPESVGVVYCGAIYVDTNTRLELRRSNPWARGDVRSLLLDDRFLPHASSVVVRRSLFDVSGFHDEELPMAEDADLWIRLSEWCQFDFVDGHLVAIGATHGRRLTYDDEAKVRGLQRFMSKHHDSLTERYRAHLTVRVGASLCHLGRLKEGRRLFGEAIRLEPGSHARTRLYWLITFLPRPMYRFVRRVNQLLNSGRARGARRHGI